MKIAIFRASWACGRKSNRPSAFLQVPHTHEPITSMQHSKSGFGTSILGPHWLTLLKNKVPEARLGETRLLCYLQVHRGPLDVKGDVRPYYVFWTHSGGGAREGSTPLRALAGFNLAGVMISEGRFRCTRGVISMPMQRAARSG